eukprot:3328644-Amphidinium_carterae.1
MNRCFYCLVPGALRTAAEAEERERDHLEVLDASHVPLPSTTAEHCLTKDSARGLVAGDLKELTRQTKLTLCCPAYFSNLSLEQLARVAGLQVSVACPKALCVELKEVQGELKSVQASSNRVFHELEVSNALATSPLVHYTVYAH